MLTYQTSTIMRQMAQSAVKAEQATLFPAVVMLAMSACESAWWTRVTGNFNYWGITRNPEDGPAKFCETHEDVTPAELARFRADEKATADGVKALGGGRIRFVMKRWFASYASMDESVLAYVNLFIRSPRRYASAWQGYLRDGDATRLLQGILAAGYATGDAAATEITIEHQANIRDAVAAARAELGL